MHSSSSLSPSGGASPRQAHGWQIVNSRPRWESNAPVGPPQRERRSDVRFPYARPASDRGDHAGAEDEDTPEDDRGGDRLAEEQRGKHRDGEWFDHADDAVPHSPDAPEARHHADERAGREGRH